jgi:6-phosphogluconolactonase
MGNGITSCSFDPQSGRITIMGSTFQRNPSYPIVSANGKVLYAAEEMFASESPQLVSYKILENGSLCMLNALPLPADYACHLAIANQTILTTNYVSGDVFVYALEEDGQVGPRIQRIQHTGSGVNKERQEAPHPHMLYPVDDRMIYCIDLGIDQAKAYSFEASSKKWNPAPELDIKVKAGAGARHMDMDRNRECLALLGELSGELFLFRRIKDGFQLVDTALLGEKEMSAAAIRIHANGRFIYCSERKSYSIYAFSISDNKLEPIGKFHSGGATPRDIAIDPTGNWLLAANQDNNTIAVFAIDRVSGALQLAHSCYVPTPSCICWHTQDRPVEDKTFELSRIAEGFE